MDVAEILGPLCFQQTTFRRLATRAFREDFRAEQDGAPPPLAAFRRHRRAVPVPLADPLSPAGSGLGRSVFLAKQLLVFGARDGRDDR